MDVVGWGDANLELVEGALFVYLGVDGADGVAVAPEDLERVLGPAIGFIEGDLQACRVEAQRVDDGGAEAAQGVERGHGEGGGRCCAEQVTCADGHADGGRGPQARGGGQTSHVPSPTDDGARPQKPTPVTIWAEILVGSNCRPPLPKAARVNGSKP